MKALSNDWKGIKVNKNDFVVKWYCILYCCWERHSSKNFQKSLKYLKQLLPHASCFNNNLSLISTVFMARSKDKYSFEFCQLTRSLCEKYNATFLIF